MQAQAHCFFNGFSPARGVTYAVAQLFGALVAAAINLLIYQPAIRDFEQQAGLSRGSPEGLASAPGASARRHTERHIERHIEGHIERSIPLWSRRFAPQA